MEDKEEVMVEVMEEVELLEDMIPIVGKIKRQFLWKMMRKMSQKKVIKIIRKLKLLMKMHLILMSITGSTNLMDITNHNCRYIYLDISNSIKLVNIINIFI